MVFKRKIWILLCHVTLPECLFQWLEDTFSSWVSLRPIFRGFCCSLQGVFVIAHVEIIGSFLSAAKRHDLEHG